MKNNKYTFIKNGLYVRLNNKGNIIFKSDNVKITLIPDSALELQTFLARNWDQINQAAVIQNKSAV